jgi:hypothetical protein
MRVIRDLDILEGRDEQRAVTVMGACALAVVALGAVPVALLAPHALGAWQTVAWTAVGYAASLPVHELVHALFFRVLGGRGTRVRFGFKSGMLYATSPGARYGRAAFVAILLAPLVVVSVALLAVGVLVGDATLCWLLVGLHASGCVGDVYFAWACLRTPGVELCEDTERGIRLLGEDEPAPSGTGGR